MATLNNGKFESDSNNALFNPQFNSNWSAVFSQPLLRGFRIDAQRRQLQVTRINRDITDVQVRAAVTNTVSNVRNAYWDYVYTTQAVEVARQSLDLASKLVQDNQTRVEIGTMAPIDVVQAQAEQATRRQALVNAENDRRTAELALKRLIVSGTEDPTWAATLDPVERPEFRPEPVDLEGAIRRALSERTDIAITKKNIENNSTTLRYPARSDAARRRGPGDLWPSRYRRRAANPFEFGRSRQPDYASDSGRRLRFVPHPVRQELSALDRRAEHRPIRWARARSRRRWRGRASS